MDFDEGRVGLFDTTGELLDVEQHGWLYDAVCDLFDGPNFDAGIQAFFTAEMDRMDWYDGEQYVVSPSGDWTTLGLLDQHIKRGAADEGLA